MSSMLSPAFLSLVRLGNEVASPEFFMAASARPPAVVSAATESVPSVLSCRVGPSVYK